MQEVTKPVARAHYYVAELYRDGSNAQHLDEERTSANRYHDISIAILLAAELTRRTRDNSVFMVLAEECECQDYEIPKFPADTAARQQEAVLAAQFERP
jgi:hypothetical protein